MPLTAAGEIPFEQLKQGQMTAKLAYPASQGNLPSWHIPMNFWRDATSRTLEEQQQSASERALLEERQLATEMWQQLVAASMWHHEALQSTMQLADVNYQDPGADLDEQLRKHALAIIMQDPSAGIMQSRGGYGNPDPKPNSNSNSNSNYMSEAGNPNSITKAHNHSMGNPMLNMSALAGLFQQTPMLQMQPAPTSCRQALTPATPSPAVMQWFSQHYGGTPPGLTSEANKEGQAWDDMSRETTEMSAELYKTLQRQMASRAIELRSRMQDATTTTPSDQHSHPHSRFTLSK